jgi:tRNA dimethylallyltransferase
MSPVEGPQPLVVALVGATAVGKSGLAMELAERIHGEIVNADSMQLYRGMNIGTAKASTADRKRVRHHLLDVLAVTEVASVAKFQTAAREAISDIHGRGLAAIVVGGSGLYVRAVLDDLRFPGTNAELRAELEVELLAVGPAALHARLAERDPAAAAAILATNGRRIVRALEVIELTGGPFTATLPGPDPVLPAIRIGLEVPRPLLAERIESRVNSMWQAGLLDEVEELLAVGLAQSRTAARALGYQQAIDQLSGRLSESGAKAATVQATLKFARRQVTWFRRDPLVHWLPFDLPDLLDVSVALLPTPRLGE